MRKIAIFLIALMLSLVLSMGTASAWFWGKRKITVDCTQGQNPQNVLDWVIGSRPLILYLIGTCSGFEISRDDVTVAGAELVEDDDDDENGENGENNDNGENGGCATIATINGEIELKGARRVQLYCLEVTGNGNGIDAYEGASALVQDCFIHHNDRNGITVVEGSSVLVENCEIVDNGGPGAVIAESAGSFSETQILRNTHAGITGDHGARIGIADESSVSNNFGMGVQLSLGSTASLAWDVTVTENEIHGIVISEHSFVEVRDSEIWNNGGPHTEIQLNKDSGLVLKSGASVDGTQDGSDAIICNDGESSLANEGATVVGFHNCTGF
jgi:hypothetical protein